MADSSFQADLSHDPIAELGQLMGRNDLQQKSKPTDSHFRERFASGESDNLPRVRLGGLTVVMTIISFLLVSSAGFFGYRAIFGSNSTSPSASAVKASREPNKIALAPSMPQDQFGHGQVGAVATGSIENWVSREGQSTQMSHAVATIPITTHPNAPSEVATPTDAASRAMVVSSQATPRGTKVSEVPTSSAVSAAARRVAANPGQLADSPVGSGANSSPASEAAPALRNGFAVQVASERSQSGAQASFRKLQAKYPNQLRGHQPVIRRADLGAAGTYYRALVGPFASRDMAVKLCSGLKAVGGDCIVQKI